MALPNNKLYHPMTQPNKPPNGMAKWHCQMTWPNGTAKRKQQCANNMVKQHSRMVAPKGVAKWQCQTTSGTAQSCGQTTLPNHAAKQQCPMVRTNGTDKLHVKWTTQMKRPKVKPTTLRSAIPVFVGFLSDGLIALHMTRSRRPF